jgi:hypothetical protein
MTRFVYLAYWESYSARIGRRKGRRNLTTKDARDTKVKQVARGVLRVLGGRSVLFGGDQLRQVAVAILGILRFGALFHDDLESSFSGVILLGAAAAARAQ